MYSNHQYRAIEFIKNKQNTIDKRPVELKVCGPYKDTSFIIKQDL